MKTHSQDNSDSQVDNRKEENSKGEEVGAMSLLT